MKKHLFALASVTTLAVIITGCSPVKWKDISYLSPANEVTLKANPSINVVALGNQKMLSPLVATIKKEFAKSGQFKINTQNPDYWIVLNGETSFRADDRNASLYNKKTVKKSSITADGGYEYITSTNSTSSTATKFLSVAVYSVNDLAPVHYFDIAIYDADFTSRRARTSLAYNAKFTEQLITKIKDSFLIQKRKVETAIPKAADDKMIEALLKGNTKAVEARATALKLGYIEDKNSKDKKEVKYPLCLREVEKNIKAGKYKEQAEALEELLCNYYVLTLAKELNDFSPNNLKNLHRQHTIILNYAQEEGLTIAVPNTLARLESKLKLLNALK